MSILSLRRNTVMQALPDRIAIVHDWFTAMRGGEKCVEVLCELFPGAEIYTLLHLPGSVSPTIEQMAIHTSFVQHLPLAAKQYRYYLPLFPAAISRFDLSSYDLVISSNHCVAKGVRTDPERTLHICYCHTPMRYIWDLYDDYFGEDRAGMVTRMGMRAVRGYLRRWDVRTAHYPQYFVANSNNVRQKIARIYDREATVIYPPVDVESFAPSREDEGFFLVVSALVPYKRVDLAIAACMTTGDRLVVIGEGPEGDRLRRNTGPNITFVGRASDEELRRYYARCSAVIFPGEEDFGIVPVEAMAAGKPVIAYGKGGATETVTDAPENGTGILFQEQSVGSLVAAMARFRGIAFLPGVLHQAAQGFAREKFKSGMHDFIGERWREFRT
jgi:glycosyltransferase involved in cell wall biosynthesis